MADNNGRLRRPSPCRYPAGSTRAIADGANGNGVPDCEAFYLLLNEIDGGGPISPSRTTLESRAASLLVPHVALVRAHLTEVEDGSR